VERAFDPRNDSRVALLVYIKTAAAHDANWYACNSGQGGAKKIGFGQKEMYDSGTTPDQQGKQLCSGEGEVENQ
jgi:hypothetical protein